MTPLDLQRLYVHHDCELMIGLDQAGRWWNLWLPGFCHRPRESTAMIPPKTEDELPAKGWFRPCNAGLLIAWIARGCDGPVSGACGPRLSATPAVPKKRFEP